MRRLVAATAVAAGAIGLVAVTAAPAAAAGPPPWNPCSLPVLATVCAVPGDIAGGAFDAITAEFAKAAATLLNALYRAIDTTTSVNVTASWFVANYRTIAKVGLSALLVLFFVQLITAAIQRRPGGLTRAVTGTGTGLLATSALLAVTQIALLITDDICTWIGGTGTGSLQGLATRLLPLGVIPGVTGAMLLVGSLLVIVGAFVLWAVLLFRKIAIYLVLVFAPVAFAGQAWEGSRSWTRRALHALAALIFCKVTIVTVFVLGLAAAGRGTGLTTLLTGVILLGIACLAPWLTFRFFHFVDVAIAHEHYRLLRDSPAGSPVRTATSAVARVQRLAGLTGVGLTSGGGASAAGTVKTPSTSAQAGTRQGGTAQPGTASPTSGQPGATTPPVRIAGSGRQTGSPQGPNSTAPESARPPESSLPREPGVPPTIPKPPPTSGPPSPEGEAGEGGPA